MASTISLGIGSLGIGLGTLGITVMLGVVGNRAALAQAAPTDTQPVPVAQTVAQYYDGPEIDFSEESPLPTIPRAFNLLVDFWDSQLSGASNLARWSCRSSALPRIDGSTDCQRSCPAGT